MFVKKLSSIRKKKWENFYRGNRIDMAEKFSIGIAIDPGLKRRAQPNQDSIGTSYIEPDIKHRQLLVLSDGMGGYGGGELASKITVSTLIKTYAEANNEKETPLETLRKGINNSIAGIIEKSFEDSAISEMGCTVVAAILTENNVYLANVGDSRAYLITDSDFKQISYDHSLVAELVRCGRITLAEADKHPRRNVLTMALSPQIKDIKPYTNTVRWNYGDRLLLCSDGLWGPVSEPLIETTTRSLEPQAAANELIRLANLNHGPDNISVIIARNGGPVRQSAEKAENENKIKRPVFLNKFIKLYK